MFSSTLERGIPMLNNIAEAIETIGACATIAEQAADDHRELWAVVVALRACQDYLDKLAEKE